MEVYLRILIAVVGVLIIALGFIAAEVWSIYDAIGNANANVASQLATFASAQADLHKKYLDIMTTLKKDVEAYMKIDMMSDKAIKEKIDELELIITKPIRRKAKE